MTAKLKDDISPEDFGISALDAEKARYYAAFLVAAERERWRSAAHRAVTAGYDELPDALYALDELLRA